MTCGLRLPDHIGEKVTDRGLIEEDFEALAAAAGAGSTNSVFGCSLAKSDYLSHAMHDDD